jgi:hypothetical protein
MKVLHGGGHGMPKRKLKIIKLTPIAMSVCESCNMQFESRESVEDDAETEMKAEFHAHTCVTVPHPK